ncbi:TM0106 family RecB-like putative nuclease [Xylanimonas ulmi]|uniref:AAA+ ATPase domain-containing protein n=1 Tax=Xylanimonas ulmi TaxID=228973 RepID=A0A4Q7M7Y2_9MICO|nr:bifunctional RecB family nuclease/DEAD/DEAH box helicase [Xylanibacterium ulmi]RZS62239.1 uncharacterized protein EV386_2564 [Xylanibacterium ulmi]
MKIPQRWSASQLVAAANCEYAYVRALEGSQPDVDADAMLERTSALGSAHEERVLEAYRAEHGRRLVEILRPSAKANITRMDARAATLDAVAAQAPVIVQAACLTDGFTGYADFLVRQPDGRYRIQDTKLARHAKVSALLQVAAYADHLRELGVPVDDSVDLVLGDGATTTHALLDIEPVYAVRRRRIEELRAEVSAATESVEWGDGRYTACGRCPVCEEQIQASRDVLLVANLNVNQRRVLHATGIVTIDDLAISAGAVPGIGAATLENLRLQARLQIAAESLEAQAGSPQIPPYEAIAPEVLGKIPTPDEGDIFFDFEGDPLYNEGGGGRWGLDYLFGWVDNNAKFDALWAHNFREERDALRAFLDHVAERRRTHPDMRIYHYAAYEKTHLLSLAVRHETGEDEVNELLRQEVLVDLYPIVRRALRVGSRSYSIKKLEPLYMGDDYRDDEGVTNALGSVDAYVAATERRDDGDAAGWQAELDKIADYNEYDCRSTLRLRDWLLEVAAQHGVSAGSSRRSTTIDEITDDPENAAAKEPTPEAAERTLLAESLRKWAGDLNDPDRTADQRAAGLVAGAVQFHDRENRIWWGDFFTKRSLVPDELATARNVFTVESGAVEQPWQTDSRGRTGRKLRLTGSWAGGSDPSGVKAIFLLYPAESEHLVGKSPSVLLAPAFSGSVSSLEDDGSIIVRESLPEGQTPHDDVPASVVPGPPPSTAPLQAAISEWAARVLDDLDANDGAFSDEQSDPILDVLRRIPPRSAEGTLAEVVVRDNGEPDAVAAIVTSLLELDGSYLAVQGPPGTGKTYTAAHVIKHLVEDYGWRVGVVAQSHKVIENALEAVTLDAGLDKARVGKKYNSGNLPRHPRTGEKLDAKAFREIEPEFPYTVVHTWKGFTEEDFLAANEGRGYVYGATAWSISGTPWDLLVVDEAGQFSLAMTAAAQGEARRILFLGDPQQLPQVSQASHPEPIDESALGWIADGEAVLPNNLGYFLALTRRMSPALTEVDSHLSYDGELEAHTITSTRHLAGHAPGCHPVPVPHRGNIQASTEEAAAVVRIIRGLLGATWSNGDDTGRPLVESDFIVVTPYNAQRVTVREALRAAGLGGVPVGTVDKFQGQEAVIAIVSMAASDAREVPRGMDFLIDRNRLNVAISRAKWAAYIVHSPHLLAHVPQTPEALARLSGLARLVDPRGL